VDHLDQVDHLVFLVMTVLIVVDGTLIVVSPQPSILLLLNLLQTLLQFLQFQKLVFIKII
jgi:hypothetical protein